MNLPRQPAYSVESICSAEARTDAASNHGYWGLKLKPLLLVLDFPRLKDSEPQSGQEMQKGNKISGELKDQIRHYVMVKTDLRPADLAFVFGTRHGITEFAEAIASYWHRNFFPWIMVTGGSTLGGPQTESEILRDALVDRGVDPKRVLCERQSRNTGENVAMALPILRESLPFHMLSSVIAVGKISSSRRYLMTLQRYWPRPKKMILPINYFGVPEEEWFGSDDFRSRVLAEWEKIPRYLKMGFLAELQSDRLRLQFHGSQKANLPPQLWTIRDPQSPLFTRARGMVYGAPRIPVQKNSAQCCALSYA